MTNTILAIGPRELPPGGTVRVWVDSGSGPGYEIQVPVDHLHVAGVDDGRGTAAIYALRVRECRG